MKKILLSCSVLAIVAFAACKKNSPAPSYTAQVMFVNGCAGTVNINVTVQNAAIAGATNLGFLKNSGYQGIPGGSDNLSFILSSTGTPLISTTSSFTANLNYSVFLGGLVNNCAPLILSDDMTPPASGSAKVRLVNLSHDTLSLTGNAGSVAFATGITSGTASSFATITAGTYIIKAGDPSNIGSVVSAPSQAYASGKIYTLIYTGTSTGTLSSILTLTVIPNN
jgi:hypothetical protein